MSDFIAPSRKISAWLDEEKITIKVDELAPVVAEHYDPIPKNHDPADYGGIGCAAHTSDRDGCLHHYMVDLKRNVPVNWGKVVCPYFGPGGEGNSLKALRVLVEKKIITWNQLHIALCCSDKPSGIALHDLLEKLREAK